MAMTGGEPPSKRAKAADGGANTGPAAGTHAGGVVILDYGSQYTQLIARKVRELGVYAVLLPGDAELSRVQEHKPAAVVLSGGPNSVHWEGAPQAPEGFWEWQEEVGTPTLGICYGMQLIVKTFGGVVTPGDAKEYGRMVIHAEDGSSLYNGQALEQSVWMSHGDEASELPSGFTCVARSAQAVCVAIENTTRKVYGIQYHPEVTHSEKGIETLRNFVFNIAGCAKNWTMQDVLDEQVAAIRAKVPEGAHAICALSGGVDSCVAATLVHRAIGDRLHCVFVDNGLLRYKEAERVMSMFKDQLHLPVTLVDAKEEFLGKLKGVTEPEKKRKIIGAEFIAVFDRFAKGLEAELGHVPEFLVQGTLYPDVIESAPPPGSGMKHSHTIKSHHNVGGLPEKMRFALIEPLRWLFKDEVRRLGALIEVPKMFLSRHPFPGPGLAVRVIGDVCAEGALDTIRLVDEIFIEEIKAAGLYDEIWQAFAVHLPVKSVGVQGDCRTHRHVVALRAITSADGMTADWYDFTPAFLRQVSTKICNRVEGVNRVAYDITSKPPATVEWE
uniref:GMP synthase [glutamine-hydrolyzing] n=1 Tax=Prasinoderma coloniale TaxID=156133 RepID=A0A7R9TQX8_9VIRI|eukprot:PRCOL_00000667-RA